MHSDFLLAMIDDHPVMQHHVFKILAAQKQPPKTLSAFLRQMGAFCESSRQPGEMVAVLRRNGYAAAADGVEKILLSECGHDRDFAQMAKLLLKGSPEADQNWFIFPEEVLGKETLSARHTFNLRQIPELSHVLSALGAMFVVELAAHRQIIPGEVTAFTGRGYYGLSLAQIPYLDGHAGEHGAEKEHEDLILQVIDSLPDTASVRKDLTLGCHDFLEVLACFYDLLETIIR